MNDVFREVRDRVTAEDAARRYGLSFDRRGWARCPFHEDKHPSISFKNGHFRCWACDASGDAVDFAGRLFGLDPMGAVRRLNEDFALALPMDRPPSRQEREAAAARREPAEKHVAFEAWREDFLNRLAAAFRVGHLALLSGKELTGPEAVAVRYHAEFEYWADTLAYGTPADQAAIYRGRGHIAHWIETVLNNS